MVARGSGDGVFPGSGRCGDRRPFSFHRRAEFGRVLFDPLTIYLSLPLSCAHWAIIRGWAEPHCASRSGLIPPGIMVVYTPRDEHEVTVCRSLFWISYNFSL